MRQHFKRVVSAVLATALVAQVGVVSAWAAPFKAQEVPAAAGMHPFTGTPDLIRSAAEELKARGVTAQEKQQDEALVQRVETTADKSYDAVKSDLAQALVAQRGEGTVDVADLGLSMQDLAAVLHETLYEKYMNNAVTDVSYETTGGKVTGIRYNMSEGFAAAMDAVDADQLDDVDTEAEAEASVQQASSAVAVYANEEEEGGCRNHTVGGVSYKGDLNGDGKVTAADLTLLRDMALGKREEDLSADMNGDGKITAADLTVLRDIALGKRDPETTEIPAKVTFEWEEKVDSTPITDEQGKVQNGGLLYDAENKKITQGILPDYSYNLTKISFTCGVCGETVEITDAAALANFQANKDVYVNTKTGSQTLVDHGKAFTAPDGESADDYLLYTDMQIATYMDDTFSVDENGAPKTDEKGNVIGLYTDSRDNGSLEVQRYYAMLSAFNADNAEYLGVSSDYWTAKNTEANPMAAVKVLCNIDADTQVPPAQMIQLVQMLPQAFMAYVHYYGAELLAMRDQAMAVVKALPKGTTEIQKQLVLHDWLADNCTFDMGVMTNVTGSGGNPETDPIQMTTFGSLLSDQLTEMPTYTTTDANGNTVNKAYYGAICLGYTAGYTYLLQNLHPEVYKTTDGIWKTPAQVGDDDLVDFIQAKFYADTAETSVAGEGFGGGAFNNVHYMNAVRLPNADNKADGEWFYTDVCYDDIYVECMAQYRGEVQGSIYHTYFLMSPQSIAKLYEKGKSIDYIDSLYDGYVYEVAKDADGKIIPSENVDSSKEYYDPTHPKYNKVETSNETKNDNTSYEDSWFSGAVSRIYNDGTNWYYVDGGSTMASQRGSVEKSDQMDNMKDQFDMKAIVHSQRVNVEKRNKLKSRAVTAPDYWTSSSSGSMMGDNTKTDPHAVTLFDYGTGKFAQNAQAPVLADEAKRDFIYTEQYPSLTHSVGLYEGKLYFNLGNAIYTYDLSAAEGTNPVALFKEYDTVKYSSDGRAFTASSYYVDANGSKTVQNKPIAALEIYEDYDFTNCYTPVMDESGNPVGMQFDAAKLTSNPTLTVNVATNFSFSYPNAANAEVRYSQEAVNLNPDYQRQVSDEGDNSNSEFLWCANIRDSAKMTDLLNDLANGANSEVSVAASCTSPAFTQTRTDKYGLVKGDKTVAEGDKALGHSYKFNADEGVYICETCGLHAYVLLETGEGGTASMSSKADSGMGSMGSIGGMDSEVTPVDPAREAATKAKDGKITLKVTPDEGYTIGEVYYVEEAAAETTEPTEPTEPETQADEDTSKVPLTANADGTYTITKPEASITVHVTFEKNEPEVKSHAITIGELQNGKVTAAVNGEAAETAEENADVTLTATPNEGYRLKAETLAVSYQIPGENAGETKTEQAVLTPVEGKEGVYTFKMPAADVTVTAEFEQTYKVKVDATLENGDVKADKDRAAADETVQLTVTPDEGYELESIGVTYTDGNGQTQNVTVNKDNTFEMPAGDVNVTASFKAKAELHNVTVTVQDDKDVPQGGKATAQPSKAAAGETVKLDIQPDDGWSVWQVTVNGEPLTPDPNTKKDYQFEMPDEDVKVVVEFVNNDSPAPEA